jgi:hypothetical protein
MKYQGGFRKAQDYVRGYSRSYTFFDSVQIPLAAAILARLVRHRTGVSPILCEQKWTF